MTHRDTKVKLGTIRSVLVQTWGPVALQLRSIGRTHKLYADLVAGRKVVLTSESLLSVLNINDPAPTTGCVELSGDDALTEVPCP